MFLKSIVEAGKYRAVIDRRYPLEQVVEATQYVETKQKTGNVVLMVGDDARELGELLQPRPHAGQRCVERAERHGRVRLQVDNVVRDGEMRNDRGRRAHESDV